MDGFTPDLRPYVSGGSRGNKGFVSDAVRGRRTDACTLLDAGVRFLQHGIDARLSRAFLIDTANSLHDEISSLVGLMRKDLSAEHLPTEGAEVDCSELEAMIAKLETAR